MLSKTVDAIEASRAEFKAKKASHERSLQARKPDDLSATGKFRADALDLRAIAVYSNLLDEDSASSNAFSLAAEQFGNLSRALSPPGRMAYYEALVTCLLANTATNMEDAKRLSEHIPGDDKKAVHPDRSQAYVNDRLDFVLSLPYLLLGDMGCVERLAEEASQTDPKKAWYPGLGEMLHGLAAADESEFRAGLSKVLAKHAQKAASKSSWLWALPERYLCMPAAALLVIARDRHTWVIEEDFKGRRKPLKVVMAAARNQFDLPVGEVLEFSVPVDFLKLPVSTDGIVS